MILFYAVIQTIGWELKISRNKQSIAANELATKLQIVCLHDRTRV